MTETKGWAIFKNGKIYNPSTTRHDEHRCIQDFEDCFVESTWEMLVDKGFSCVPVTIREEAQTEEVYTWEEMRKAFEVGRNYQLTGENNLHELYRGSIVKPKE